MGRRIEMTAISIQPPAISNEVSAAIDQIMKHYSALVKFQYLGKSKVTIMERIIDIHIERLPEGMYLATSKNLQGLVAQGRTISETLEIARDVAKKLIEAQEQEGLASDWKVVGNSFNYPLVVGF